MNVFSMNQKVVQGIPVLEMDGYFNKNAGDAVIEKVQTIFKGGGTSLILDLTKCHTINSLGVSSLYVIANTIVDDFIGTLALVGLDETQATVLELSGVLHLAILASSLEEACKAIPSAKK